MATAVSVNDQIGRKKEVYRQLDRLAGAVG